MDLLPVGGLTRHRGTPGQGALTSREAERYVAQDPKKESQALQDGNKIAAGKQVLARLQLKVAKSHEVHLFIPSQNKVV